MDLDPMIDTSQDENDYSDMIIELFDYASRCT